MSWFWGGKASQNDPTKSLDPELKQFLNEQQPKPYVLANPPPVEEQAKVEVERPNLPDTNQKFEERQLPKESLFQDGRYKDLWKTYIPQNEVLASTTTPVERVLTARKDRREMMHRAALENCAFEQEIQTNCFHNGDVVNRVRARMTMCRQETKAFNRCYQLQAKFLQALGYLASSTSTNEDEEKIQMHADKLYHRMMDYEADVEEAKRNSKPIPPLSSIFDPSRPAPTIEQINLPEGMQNKLKKPLHEYAPHERELVARAALQEAKMSHLWAEDFFKYTTTMNEDRKGRQQLAVKVFGETVGKFLIPDPPKALGIEPYTPEALDRDVWKNSESSAPGPVDPSAMENNNRDG